jgi:LysM repeat protein
MLRVGQHLVIPAKAGSAAAPSPGSASAAAAPVPGATASAKSSEPMAPKAPADAVKHTVKAGETLGSIARHYGVRMGDLATANNISDPKRIRPGQELIIPAKSAGTKSGRAAKSKSATSAPTAAAASESAPTAPAPAAGGDLDSGLQPPTAAEVPVVKVDDGANPPPKNP